MKLIHTLLAALLAFTAVSASAADIDAAGLPSQTNGALWARKSGTTNTMQDVVSTGNALHVTSTPPTGTSSTQVQGPVADGAADTAANPVEIGGTDGTNIQTIKTDSDGELQVDVLSVSGVAGTAAHDAAISGNPVRIGARATTGGITPVANNDTIDFVVSTEGVPLAGNLVSGSDDVSNTNYLVKPLGHTAGAGALLVSPSMYDGTTHDMLRGDSINGLKTYHSAPQASNIVAGSQSYTSTQAATTIITIPAGTTWVGEVSISASSSTVAGSATAGQALGVVTTTGAGTTPAAGQVMDCEARNGANAATGTVGSQGNNSCRLTMAVNCASGTCTIAGATTQAGTASRVSFSATGRIY